MDTIYSFRRFTREEFTRFRRSLVFTFFMMILITGTAFGQQEITVTGHVFDENEQPLPGATVQVEGTNIGAVTNVEGFYEIDAYTNSTLIFSFIGYESRSIPVEGRSTINTTLTLALGELDEVVIVGYADMSRMRTTSAISSIDTEELQNIPSVNPVQALQGKMSGVSIPVLSGQPGAGANIVIRGGTTIRPYGEIASGRDVGRRDPSDPLVIVDGVFRNLDDINPDDIESIQVMKDAASTAIYGARGANGVIVVTTKSGRGAGRPNFTFRYQHGLETPARQYDYLNAREYLDLARRTVLDSENNTDGFQTEWLFNGPGSQSVQLYSEPGEYGRSTFYTAYLDNLIQVEGQEYVDDLLVRGWETMDDPANPGNTIIFKDSRYQDVVWQNAVTNNFNFGVTGSTDNINYNLSLGYVDQGGTFLGTGYKRFSALANTGYQVNDDLNITLNLSYLWNDDQYSDNTIRDLTRGVRVPPLTRQYYDDGTPALGESNNPRNRLHQLYYQDYNDNTGQFTVRLAADYQIMPNLQMRPSVSLNTSDYRQDQFEAFYPQQPRPRDKYQRIDERTQIMIDNVLQYTNTFGSHNVMGLAGFNYTRNSLFRLVGQSQRAATDYISTITGDPQTSIVSGNVVANMNSHSLYNEDLSASLFSQFNYDFDERYLIGASLRYDGFSNFAPENRYALFPSVSVGWNISRENFWTIDMINQFKLRASWGQAGLSNLSINDTFGLYGASTYATDSGVTRSNLPNPNLVWETTETVDAGFDLALFDNRLGIAFDVYNKLTKDRLASLPLAAETGFGSITDNVGELRNRGLELEISATVMRSENFTWNSNFSFAFNRQIITKLPENGRDQNRINGGEVYDPSTGQIIEVGGWAEGERPDGLWGFHSSGIFATTEEANAEGVPYDTGRPGGQLDQPRNAGDVNWTDVNGDGVIDGLDLVFMGYRVPDRMGGLRNTFNYKGLTMRVAVDFALGHVISNGALARGMGQGRSYNEGAPRQALSDETWQKPGDTGKKYPRFSMGDFDVGQRNHLRFVGSITGYSGVGLDHAYGVDSSIYYEKGDWLAFREISFSYDLPGFITQRINMNRITLNAAVHNLGYITSYSGLNPEQYKGYDEGGYPRPLQFIFGATFNFH